MRYFILILLVCLTNCSEFKKENDPEASSQKISLFKLEDVEINERVSVDDLIGLASGESISIEIDRLEFSKTGELDLLGKNVNLNIKELISDSGKIDSHGQIAYLTDGKVDSGEINIIIQKAIGKLELKFDGRNGSDGKNGKDGKYEEPDGLAYSTLNGANGIEVIEDLGITTIFACAKEPEDGKSPPTIDATNGGDAQNGGSSAVGSLKIYEGSVFEIEISNTIGKGGKGGKGGKSYSSPGGKAGFVESKAGSAKEAIKKGAKSGRCRRAIDGKASAAGMNGRNGNDGRDGEKRLFCIENKKNKQCF